MLNMRDDIGIWKSMSVRRLRELLADLPPNARVVPNMIGNLLFMVGAEGEEDEWTPIAYIDIAKEEIRWPEDWKP